MVLAQNFDVRRSISRSGNLDEFLIRHVEETCYKGTVHYEKLHEPGSSKHLSPLTVHDIQQLSANVLMLRGIVRQAPHEFQGW